MQCVASIPLLLWPRSRHRRWSPSDQRRLRRWWGRPLRLCPSKTPFRCRAGAVDHSPL